MRYKDAAAFRMALEQRLKRTANGAALNRERKRIAFDRLLVRLQAVAGDRWALKGGFALDLRLAARARSTKDVDIEWRAAADELADTLLIPSLGRTRRSTFRGLPARDRPDGGRCSRGGRAPDR